MEPRKSEVETSTSVELANETASQQESPRKRSDTYLFIATLVLTVISIACFVAMAIIVYKFDGLCVGSAPSSSPQSSNWTLGTPPPPTPKSTPHTIKSALQEKMWSKSVSVIYALISGDVLSGLLGLIFVIVLGKRAKRQANVEEPTEKPWIRGPQARRFIGIGAFIICMALIPAGIMVGERGIFDIRERERVMAGG
ncbi:hypothetical protein H072_6732 [Dactylellina haptotyla CBS 200.50]|uniref:Transmembrane protein n=1 Tax=Dactylellina haptotyla (strain CBS 200.50) TaxID=1284197 RepID=S8A9K5_DACHA|nr:hypothetical protein H072_6732 [Dactylellina haptotyla CBS 200.50]